MAINIDADRMTLTIGGTKVATAGRTGDRWIVSTWPDTLTYNGAITALTLAERLAHGYDDDDSFVVVWREELASA